jgi:hypothetical protein
MNHRVENAVKEYDKRFSSFDENGLYRRSSTRNGNKAAFYIHDLEDVAKMGKGIVFEAIEIALKAGFVIGYRCRQMEEKKAKK